MTDKQWKMILWLAGGFLLGNVGPWLLFGAWLWWVGRL